MSRTKRSTITAQLTLIPDFEKFAKRDSRLVEELRAHIGNLKYLRINTDYTDFKNKVELVNSFNQLLYWTAFLMWKKSRYLVEKEAWKLDNFLALTKDRPDLFVTVAPSQEEMMEKYFRTNQRMKTTFMAYRELLQEDIGTTKRILEQFNTLHNLADAV